MVYRLTNISSRFQFAFFTFAYWRYPADSGETTHRAFVPPIPPSQK
jgi:hypothetical protein